MWIPYDIRASLKAESDPASIRMSRADESQRDFLVGFFLRNPVTQAWELDIVASAAGQELATLATPPGMRISFHGNDAGKLSEVIYRLPAISAQDALHRAHDDFQRRVLRYMAEIGRGMAIAGWRIADTGHSARWRCTPFRPSAMNLDFDRLAPIASDLAPYVELFQRARNAPDAASRLLAAYALIHAALGGAPALAGAGQSDFAVTQEMLIHAGAMEFSDRLLGRSLADLAEVLRPEQQRLAAPEGVLAALSDSLAAQQRLAQLANLADLVAHRLIQAELRQRAQPTTARPLLAAQADGTPAHASGVQPC
ncbi:methylamine utilization protein MauJ [Paracoccus aminophilus]|uniref:Methylamine utilization protein mauJ n=1 Tax=Paracoccus aminophilus JCM 7686 TaxID=1367847 RepID=S5XJB6_PARAH|nr:methylamine utilization protein MauJ [Paracoccus aminophilus]AGT07279.1 methylamine utilization protein mauJ [Paracoccus aminophilus JCM 7686]